VHRIGQERDVEIVHLDVTNTIEDSIKELQEKKKTIAAAVMGEAKVTEGIKKRDREREREKEKIIITSSLSPPFV
jgi:SNF2 family DNA or RNA helicase